MTSSISIILNIYCCNFDRAKIVLYFIFTFCKSEESMHSQNRNKLILKYFILKFMRKCVYKNTYYYLQLNSI